MRSESSSPFEPRLPANSSLANLLPCQPTRANERSNETRRQLDAKCFRRVFCCFAQTGSNKLPNFANSLVVRGHRAVDTSEEQVEGPGAESTVVNAPAKLLLELEDSAAGTVGAVDERVYAEQQRRASQ